MWLGEERPSRARGRVDGRMKEGGGSHWGRVGVGHWVGENFKVWGLVGLLRNTDPTSPLGALEACLIFSPHGLAYRVQLPGRCPQPAP